jgi:hypothetical protein
LIFGEYNLFISGCLVFKNSSFSLLVNVVFVYYFLKCGMWDRNIEI